MNKFTKPDIAEIIDESIRKIKTWTDLGLITPDIVPATGKGVEQVYSQKNLIEFGMIKLLKDKYACSINFIRHILTSLNKEIDITKDAFTKLDFFSDPQIGINKEILYISQDFKTNRGIYIYVAKKNQNSVFEIESNVIAAGVNKFGVITVISLGKIRNEAIEKFSIKLN